MGTKMGRKLLRSLDLFSGIGGLTVALRGVAEPVAYCDIDSAAQAVLADRMDKRLLPYAPVCPVFSMSCSAWWESGRGTGMSRAACSGRFCGSLTLLVRPHRIILDPRAYKPSRAYQKKNQLAPLHRRKVVAYGISDWLDFGCRLSCGSCAQADEAPG